MSALKDLHEVLSLELGKRHIEGTRLPASITANLNPRFPLRLYQEMAFKLFVNYWEEAFDGKPRQNHRLLFHMATGSGKTMMMAGLIAYLYAKGYRKFLFFVNTTNIIDKTRDNFLNARSSKYLFAPTISVGDRRVDVREVTNFQSVNMDDVNIMFTTIQGLHIALNTPRENSITFEDFEGDKVVLLSDEAHHINADTKRGDLAQEELFAALSWERTVECVFKAHPHNVLLEFTATVDLSGENLAKKYRPCLIFDYPLREFRRDGYSKEVKVLQADLDPFQRALQAVLLSQYRRKIFEKNRQHIKPVILFKSKTIKDSQTFFGEFIEGIKALRPSDLDGLRARSTDPVIQRIFQYMDAHSITLPNIIAELKEDFSEDKLISVNSKEKSEQKQIAVNSLEGNGYRAVFAVDKLNEGWDVLNLFDIVRLYDTRDSKAGKIGKTTMSEAQLIGRGARYCPFQLASDQPLYGRKFDADVDNEARICEELYYHSAYNPKYIQELNAALQELGIKPKETRERQVRLKPSFKETALYKRGFIFLNERIKYNRQDIDCLDSSVIDQVHQVALRTGFSKSHIAFESSGSDCGEERSRQDYTLASFGLAVLRKAVQRIEFYEFANLRKYLPRLTSVHEFLTSDKYLGRVKVEASGLPYQVANLTPDQKLDVAVQVLEVMASFVASDKMEFKGSTEFKPAMVKAVFTDKTLNFMLDGSEDKEFGRSMSDDAQTAYYLDLSTKAWFAFDDCFGTSEEKLLIQYIDKRYTDLKKVYGEAYLVRNEKHFKLFAFADGRPLEPDFVLFLIGKSKSDTMHYQVFIEPKGRHLLRADAWKEDFLKSIKELGLIEQLIESKNCIVWGMPFFNSNERIEEFTQSFNELIKTPAYA